MVLPLGAVLGRGRQLPGRHGRVLGHAVLGVLGLVSLLRLLLEAAAGGRDGGAAGCGVEAVDALERQEALCAAQHSVARHGSTARHT